MEQVSDPGQTAPDDFPAIPAWYFDSSRWFFRLLRFFNLLEPDRTVLSMTKFILWASTAQSIHAVMTSSDWKTIVGSIGINMAAMAKHESRRRTGSVVTVVTKPALIGMGRGGEGE